MQCLCAESHALATIIFSSREMWCQFEGSTIWGRVTIEVVWRIWQAKWTKHSVLTALCKCGLCFWGIFWLLLWWQPFHIFALAAVVAVSNPDNYGKCGAYSRVATVLLHSLLSAVSIWGRPLNVVRCLFKQIRYTLFFSSPNDEEQTKRLTTVQQKWIESANVN